MEDEKYLQLVLKRLGIQVPLKDVKSTYEKVKGDSVFGKEVEKYKNVETMMDEDKFLEYVEASHKKITNIPENQNSIQNRENTFCIRAINPEDIKSLTERAFFDSFNLQRNVMNDLEEENKFQKQTSYRQKQQKERFGLANENGQRSRNDMDQEQKCICCKNIPGSEWVQCINEDKCRGSNWYHIECAGIDVKDIEAIKQKDFMCEKCKREDDDDVEEIDEEQESGQSQIRKRVKNEESGKQ